MSSGLVEFFAKELGDVSQHALLAAKILLKDIMRIKERRDRDAHLLTAVGTIPNEAARQLIDDIRKTTKELCRKHQEVDGQTQVFVVLGVAVDDILYYNQEEKGSTTD